MRKLALFLLILLCLALITSCYDAEEIDNELYVLVIGIDRGVSDKWRITVQFSTMKGGGDSGGEGEQSGGGGGGGEGGEEGQSQENHSFIEIDAPSFFTGIDMLNTTLTRRLNFEHAQILVFSEEVARAGLMGEYFAPINRFKEVRRNAKILLTRGKASEFIKENKPFIGTTIAKGLQTFVLANRGTGFSPNITSQQFYEGLKSPCYQPIVPLAAVNKGENFEKEGEPWGVDFKTGGGYIAGELPRTGKSKIEAFGTALFKNSFMVGELTGEETRFLLIIRNEYHGGKFTIMDPKAPNLIIPIDVIPSRKTLISVDTKGRRPIIKINVNLTGELLAVQSMINYERGELKKELEGLFEKVLKKGIEDVIKKCQGLGVDAFNFGGIAQRSFFTIEKFEGYEWHEKFRNAEVYVDVDFVIRRTGTQVESYPLKRSEAVK